MQHTTLHRLVGIALLECHCVYFNVTGVSDFTGSAMDED